MYALYFFPPDNYFPHLSFSPWKGKHAVFTACIRPSLCSSFIWRHSRNSSAASPHPLQFSGTVPQPSFLHYLLLHIPYLYLSYSLIIHIFSSSLFPHPSSPPLPPMQMDGTAHRYRKVRTFAWSPFFENLPSSLIPFTVATMFQAIPWTSTLFWLGISACYVSVPWLRSFACLLMHMLACLLFVSLAATWLFFLIAGSSRNQEFFFLVWLPIKVSFLCCCCSCTCCVD
jgi:hypothetical protein